MQPNFDHAVAFTGHRPEKIRDGHNESSETVVKIKQELTRLITEKINAGCDCFLSGMAMGTDLWAAEAVLALKKEYPQIRLVAVIPFPQQADRFSYGWKGRYEAVLAQSDEQVVIHPERMGNSYKCRNEWLVEHAAHVIGVYNGKRGGTMQTLNMALTQGRFVSVIHC